MLRKLRATHTGCNSLYVTFPRYIIDTLELQKQQDVDVTIKGSKIIVETKVKKGNE